MDSSCNFWYCGVFILSKCWWCSLGWLCYRRLFSWFLYNMIFLVFYHDADNHIGHLSRTAFNWWPCTVLSVPLPFSYFVPGLATSLTGGNTIIIIMSSPSLVVTTLICFIFMVIEWYCIIVSHQLTQDRKTEGSNGGVAYTKLLCRLHLRCCHRLSHGISLSHYHRHQHHSYDIS